MRTSTRSQLATSFPCRRLARVQRELGVTTVYVTHDQSGAMTLGARVCVMRGGVLQQASPPSEIYDRPANLFVAGCAKPSGSISSQTGPRRCSSGSRWQLVAGVHRSVPELANFFPRSSYQ